jgi:hypothetical protein
MCKYINYYVKLKGREDMKQIVGAAVILAALSGCSMTAPPYSPQMDDVIKLKNADVAPAKVSAFKDAASKDNANPISLRGSQLHSPYSDTYSAYLAEALKQELTLAGKYSDTSTTEVSGTLQKNDLDTAMKEGKGTIEARFVVTKQGQVAYDQVKSAQTTWPSSFVGAIAIPAATQAYPTLVQKLMATLFSDPAFLGALK